MILFSGKLSLRKNCNGLFPEFRGLPTMRDNEYRVAQSTIIPSRKIDELTLFVD